jgi:hypothetical protein
LVPPFATAVAAVVLLGFSNGGYEAATWSLGTLAALAVGAGALVVTQQVDLSRREWLYLALLVALLVWTGLEAARPGAATRGVPELERDALYVAVAWSALLALRPANVAAALSGALAGIVVVVGSGLVTLLLPAHIRADSLEGRFLFEPLGYANACGILAVLGILLAVGLAARAASLTLRAASAAALVPLVVALYLTGSRGAAAAAVIGVSTGLALDPQRRRLAEIAMLSSPLPALGVWLASLSHVTDPQLTTDDGARNGRILAAATILLVVAQAAGARRVLRDGRDSGRAALYALMPLCAVAVAATALKANGSLGDRHLYWRAAWNDVRAHRLLGSGPGSFGVEWLQRRTTPTAVQNAHNLYLETLAELGPVGLVLVVAVLAIPLAAAVRHRDSIGATAAAAYTAFVAHAAIDWDWQMPVVTVTALV